MDKTENKFIKYLARLFNTSEEKLKKLIGYIFLVIFYGLILYGLIVWFITGGFEGISKKLLYYDNKLAQNFGASDLTELIGKLKPFLSLLWNIVLILGLTFFAFCWGAALLEKLQRVCERNRYGDFYNTYKRGLKTTGYLFLLFLPLVLWIFMWIIGDKLDSIFCSYKYWSEYSKEYYTSHNNWIMLILGFGSIPFLIALYFPIVKSIKRHFKENKGKKILLDELEDLKKENEKLKERIKSDE